MGSGEIYKIVQKDTIDGILGELSMSGVGDEDGVAEISLNSDDEFLRLLFDSEGYHDGRINDDAISTKDLYERGYSLDIKKIANECVIKLRAKEQSERVLNKDPDSEKRKVAYISTLVNSEVLECVDQNGNSLFETSHTPLDSNYAHASLFCMSRKESRHYYLYARNQLRPLLLKCMIELDDFDFS